MNGRDESNAFRAQQLPFLALRCRRSQRGNVVPRWMVRQDIERARGWRSPTWYEGRSKCNELAAEVWHTPRPELSCFASTTEIRGAIARYGRQCQGTLRCPVNMVIAQLLLLCLTDCIADVSPSPSSLSHDYASQLCALPRRDASYVDPCGRWPRV